jgi:XTP/dITP diphosphohydrolase
MEHPVIVLATGNEGKIREIRKIFGDLPLRWVTMREVAATVGTKPPDVVEDGETFLDNALLKARAIYRWSGLPALADDSGLQVDALQGAPGVYSARFAGEDATDSLNTSLLLDRLSTTPTSLRTARFRAVIALVFSGDQYVVADGACEGHIASDPAGAGGFGYDPVFIPASKDQTFAELGAEYKDRVSHRARALEQLRPLLSNLLDSGRIGPAT